MQQPDDILTDEAANEINDEVQGSNDEATSPSVEIARMLNDTDDDFFDF